MYIEKMNDLFFNAYIECALWSSTDDNDLPLDSNYSMDSFDSESLDKLRAHATKFFSDNIDLLNEAKNYSYDQAGHDLWLTENGHGAGFWDRGLGDIGEKLTKLSQYHETYIYINDGKLFI